MVYQHHSTQRNILYVFVSEIRHPNYTFRCPTRWSKIFLVKVWSSNILTYFFITTCTPRLNSLSAIYHAVISSATEKMHGIKYWRKCAESFNNYTTEPHNSQFESPATLGLLIQTIIFFWLKIMWKIQTPFSSSNVLTCGNSRTVIN